MIPLLTSSKTVSERLLSIARPDSDADLKAERHDLTLVRAILSVLCAFRSQSFVEGSLSAIILVDGPQTLSLRVAASMTATATGSGLWL